MKGEHDDLFQTACRSSAGRPDAASAASPASAFDFDDLETLERAEQDELLEKARRAVSSWNFSGARSYLDQARQKGYAPKQVKAVETLIAKNESAKAEQDRRQEEQRQARLAAEEADRRRVAAASSSSRGYGSPSYAYCSSTDACHQFVKHEKSAAYVRCTKGPSTGKEKCLSYNTKKFASGCGLTDSIAHHYSLDEAANHACQY